ncbi:NAD(P)H-dependent flavin oxidoreductase [Virgibacillus pantothenticus]|uniref:NAD(P)H-dependent flavin oxidoreductase n=1 Tax=Virgibacillus pantothenticus TaxID=1473 RepID=UPI0009858D44|nr:nitronate monooxygenase [Virgibacillus pantothenticus]
MGNVLTERLNMEYPIIQGGMGNISDPGLAAAISNAGGLGTIGAGNMSLHEVSAKINETITRTSMPYCVNVPISVHPNPEQLVQELIDLKVPVVSLSAGNPSPFISLLKQHNIIVICVSSTVRQAKKAESAGADIIVCEGYEAAGINALNESTTMTLIPQVVEKVNVPVVAAGGIADGKGLAAALSLGAMGVQMGTRFIATKEAPFHDIYKQAIIEATDESTVIVGRRYNRIRRLMKTSYANKLVEIEKENECPQLFLEKTTEEHHKAGALLGDPENGFMNGGQIAGLINDCPTVNELIETMVAEAKQILKLSLDKV